jgi:exodeoxyribonuclease VII small subunit
METDSSDIAGLSFEAALQELEALVGRLESGDLSLDESIRSYVRGDALRAHCETRLKEAQMRIERIVSPGEGSGPTVAAVEGVDHL